MGILKMSVMPFCITSRVAFWSLAFWLQASLRVAQRRLSRYDGFRPQTVVVVLLLVIAAAVPIRAQTFTQQSPAASPPGRFGSNMVFDAAHGQVVLFSGWGTGTTLLSDTWVWNGITWTQESPATSPPARGYASMVYDAALGEVVLFGGVGNTAPGSNGFFNDTWVWNGTNWTEESPATSPSGRDLSAMAYYPTGNLVVLFAGDNSNGILDDTWTWDGTNWTLRTPATSPPARVAASMVYDAAEGQIVLFGGDGDGGGRLADTWVLDENGWTQESPATSPSGRGSSAVAYDSLQGQVVLFGGANDSGLLADTWAWNGANWTQESPASGPSARWAPSMVFDSAQGQAILFGGSDSINSPYDALADTWAYSLSNFGSVAIGATSAAQSFNFSIPGGTTVGSIGVLTQGAPNLDFTDAGSDTCTATTYTSTTNCTVNVQFAPKFAGQRMGAVVIKDGSGNVLSNTYLSGVGTGPQVAFSPPTQSTLGGGFALPGGVAVDASGNVYVADGGNNAVKEMPAGCASSSCVTVLGGGYGDPFGVAVDGSGNVYVADTNNSEVKEMPPGCASSSCITILGGGFSLPYGVALDGDGNIYIADANHSKVKEMPPGCGSSSCVTILGGGFDQPEGVAVDGAGNVYIADTNSNGVKKMGPGCTAASCVSSLGGGFNRPSGVAVDGSGNVYVADYGNKLVYEMPSSCTSSSCVAKLPGSYTDPEGVALDGGGNIYVADANNHVVNELNVAAPPTLNFPTATAVGSTDTTDGTLTAQVENIGNMPLVFSAFTYPADFIEGSDENACTSSTSLTAGQVCDVPVEFAPQVAGSPLSEDVTFATNNLNGTNVQQSIGLSGTAEAAAGTMFSPAPGSTLTSASTMFRWNAGFSGVTGYYLWIGTTPGGSDLANQGPFTGTSATVNLPTNGTAIYVRLWTFLNGGAQLYNDYTYTESTPSTGVITSPTPGSTLTSASTTFNWSAANGGTANYYLWIGTTPGGSDLANQGPFTGTSAMVNLPTNGAAIYVRLWTFVNGGAMIYHNDYTYTEATPSTGVITSPTPGSALTSASTTFNWSAASGGTIQYYLWVGSSPGGSDLVNTGPFTGTGAMVNLPTNGTTIYVRLWTFVNGGAMQYHNDYTYTEATVAGGVITSPVPGGSLTTATTTFNWSAASGGTANYYLWIGTTPGGNDLVNTGPFTGTSATVNLPTNGAAIYVRLWTFLNGGATQYHNDYSYTEATVAGGAITSPTPGSTLTSASTTFNWSAGSGGTIQYYLWVGSTAGGSDLVNEGPLTGTSATVNLPTNGATIYVRLWTFINGGAKQLDNDYNYTEASEGP
jgi:hypothetical protein